MIDSTQRLDSRSDKPTMLLEFDTGLLLLVVRDRRGEIFYSWGFGRWSWPPSRAGTA